MNTHNEDDYLDRYEEETARRSAREARRRAMSRAKKRQAYLRRFGPMIAGAVCVIAVIAVSLTVIRSKVSATERGEGYTDENVTADQGILDEETADNGADGGESDADEKEPDDTAADDDGQSVDSEFGPYAEDYSAEREIFFEGDEVTGFEDASAPSEETVFITYALLIDAEDGRVISSRGGDARIYPASMTKILTILVAAERVSDLDDPVMIDISITDYAYSHDLSAVGFALGEHVTVRDLMYGTILPSGADAAIALAEYVAGSEDLFVDMMNDKLEELGLSDTAHFTNCVGLYDDDHYCTMSDMAMILKAAVENDLARQILNAHKYTTSHTPEHPEGIEISNWFLRKIEDKDTHGEVMCAKTGFVNESGSCAASYEISSSGGHYICVTVDAWSAWRCIYDHVAMYDAYVE